MKLNKLIKLIEEYMPEYKERLKKNANDALQMIIDMKVIGSLKPLIDFLSNYPRCREMFFNQFSIVLKSVDNGIKLPLILYKNIGTKQLSITVSDNDDIDTGNQFSSVVYEGSKNKGNLSPTIGSPVFEQTNNIVLESKDSNKTSSDKEIMYEPSQSKIRNNTTPLVNESISPVDTNVMSGYYLKNNCLKFQ